MWSGVGTLAVALRGIVAPCSLWTLNCPEFLPFNLYLATNVHVMLRYREMKGISMNRKPPRINRFSQIVRFIRVSRLLFWTIWVIYRERRRVIQAHERGNNDVQPNVEVLVEVLVAFRQTAIKLGVLMIKLGQFLSSRADLLPEQAHTGLHRGGGGCQSSTAQYRSTCGHGFKYAQVRDLGDYALC